MVLFMIINLLSGVNPSVVRADETIDSQHFGNNGKEVEHNGITLKETASNYSNGEFDVDLLIKSNGKTTTTQDKMDVVLVIDRSGSMSEKGKMQNTKTAAKNFVKALLKNENVRVGLVSFAGRHRFTSGRGPMLDHLPISRNEQRLTDKIDGYEPYDKASGMSRNGTFTQAGLKKANELFTDAGRKKAIILITDGEPTYAYKTEPNFNGITDFDDVKDNSIIKYTHQVWSIGTDKDGRRDPNKKNRKLGNVEGNYSTGSGKNKKEWTYKPYYVELITNYTDYVGDGSNLNEDVRVATLSEAGRLKKSGVDIFSIGIGVNDTGKAVLHDIASPNKYYDSNMSASDLNNVLSDLEHVFKEYGIDGGMLRIAMNKQVSLISESVVIEGKNTSENATEGDKQELITRVANIQSNLDQNKGEIVLNNLTLGKDEELHIKFRAKLAENWMDGVSYSINENAELTPKTNSEKIDFNIPTVKDIKTVNLVIKKNWIGGKVPTGVNFINFTIKANDKDFNGNIVRVTEDSSGNWTGKLDNLPKYKEGKDIKYTVEEVQGNNYQLKGKIESETDSNNGNITFTATNQNTEKVNITVTKKWVNTPDEYKDDIKVAIYSRAEGETDFKKGEIQTLSKSDENKKMELFTNLLKYSKEGKLIEYKVEEEGTDKEGKLKIGDNSFKVDVEQSKNNNYDWTITNTCDHIEKNIRFTLVKNWDKKPDENVKATFNLIAKVNGEIINTTPIVLPVKKQGADQSVNTTISENGKTWTTVIEPYKYDSDNNLIEYSISEEKLNAYVSDPAGEVEVVDGKTITFYNTRIMRKLTLEKKWVGNKAEKAEFTLSGNDEETITLNKGNDWSTKIDLPVYDLNGKKIEYTITEKDIDGYEAVEKTQKFTFPEDGSKIGNKTITFTNRELHKDKFTVNKIWKGEPAGRVKFGLYDGNSKVDELELNTKDAQATSQNFWSGKFKNDHPVRNLNGEVIKYEVKELDDNNKPVEKEVKLGNRTYKVESRPAENNVFIFTNTDITKGDVQIIKTWVGTEGKAKFGLFKNGDEKISNKEPNLAKTSVDGQYTVKFENVSLTDEEGKAVKYEIKELGDSDNILNTDDIVSLGGRKYKVSYDANGNITNTELIDITVTKTWGENVPQSERKSVEVDIYAGNERKKTVELRDDKWEDTVTNLPYLPDGYTVKEVEINGIEVNNDLKKLYKVEGEMEKIKETSTINITNSFDLAENKEGKINVLKHWTVDPKNIKVKLYRKTAATTTESSKWVEAGTEELNGDTKVLKTAFDKVEGSEKYQILETAVETDELTEDDIQNILSSKTESPIEYKIGEYEVTVHNLGNDTFFIKNTQDSTMKELVVKKKWSDNTLDKYKEAVQVQLYKVENNKLVPVEEPRYLNSSNWKTKFKGLRIKDAEGKNIDYRVAEVGVGNTIKTNLTLEDLQKSYKIGSSTVTIDGSDINAVVITNDVNLRDISVKKAWEGTATAGAVGITLYKKVGNELESVETKQLNSEGKWMTDFERQPKVDEEGVEIEYQIFETAIDGFKINIDPTAASGYKTDEQGISYSTGTINDGSYSVVITGNSKDNNFVVKNSFTRNPVLPVIPGGDTPGGIPVIPVVTPDPLPTPTPNPSTPVVDVPNDPSPQGPATPVNDGDEDNGVTEIDEDDVPQGDGKEVKKDNKANKANKDTVDITDNKAPKGTANLPKTGGEAGNFLSIIGLGLIGLGLVIRRRR